MFVAVVGMRLINSIVFACLAAVAARAAESDPLLEDELREDTRPLTDEERAKALEESTERDFTEFDANKDGQLDVLELTARFGGHLNPIDLFYFYTSADKDMSGTVSRAEYNDYVKSSSQQEEREATGV